MILTGLWELLDGRGAIRAYFGKRGPEVRVKSYPMPKVRQINADVAITACHVNFADGGKPDPYRMTWVVVRRDGNWRIAQHHSSPRRGTSAPKPVVMTV